MNPAKPTVLFWTYLARCVFNSIFMVRSKTFLGKYKPNIINLKLYGICRKLCFLVRKNNEIVKNMDKVFGFNQKFLLKP